jgi:hypothetical protein
MRRPIITHFTASYEWRRLQRWSFGMVGSLDRVGGGSPAITQWIHPPMRKLLVLLTFVAAGLAGLCASPSLALANQAQCPAANQTEGHLNSIQHDCWSNCDESYKKKKQPQAIPGCKASCTREHDDCLKQFNEADKKAREETHQEILCHDPFVGCIATCRKETGEQKKCEDKCKNDAPLMEKYHACIKRARDSLKQH